MPLPNYMTKVACTEINNLGKVITVTKPNYHFLSGILPETGMNILEFGDAETMRLIKDFLAVIFSSDCPIEIELELKSTPIRLTAHCIDENKALIYWKSLNQDIIPHKAISEDWGFNELTLQDKLNVEFLRREHTVRRFTDNLPLVVFEIHLFPDGRFEFGFVNKEMQTFFPGFNREAVNENNSLLFVRVHPDDKQMLFDSIKNAFNMHIWDIEYRIVENEEIRWVRGYGRPEIGSDGKTITVCAYLQDITEKKKILDELELIDFSFRRSATPMIFIKADGTFLDFNEAAYKLLGYTKEEFKALRVPQINPDYDDYSWQNRWELLKQRRAFNFTTQLKKKDGSLVNVEAGANVIEFSEIEVNCAVITDVTEKRRIEEKLKLIDFSFRNAGIPISFIKADSSFFDFNDATCALLGYTREEYEKLTIADINPLYDLDSWKKRWEEIKLSPNNTLTTKLKKKDGNWLDIEVNANIIKYGDLEINCASYKDITEKNRLDEQLKLVDHAFRNAATPMYFLNREGNIQGYNDAMCQMLGYEKEEFKQQNVFSISTRHNSATWKERWRGLERGETQPVLTKVKRKDGRLIDVEVRTNIFKYGSKELTFTSFIDISVKKKIEERLSLVDFVFKKSNVSIIIARADSTFYDFNEAALELHGYTAEEMAEMRVGNLVLGYKKEEWESAYAQVWDYLKANKTFETIVQHKKKDGAVIDVEIRANYIKYGDLELNCSFIIDITEKKKAQEAIKRSNERYEYATLATHDVIWETDLVNDTLYFGSNFTSVFGHETTGVEPGPNNIWRNSIHPDDRQRVIKSEAEVIAGNGESWETEYRLRKANGEYAVVLDRGFALKENGKPVRLIGAMQDITEKKKIEEDLRRSNERYQAATIATSDVVWEHDLRTNLLYYSSNFTSVFGHELEGGWIAQGDMNNLWWRNIHPDDFERAVQFEKQVLESDGSKWESEYRLRKADGTYALVFDRGFAIKDENGKVIRWIGAMQDVTEKRQIEEDLKKSNQRYEYATLATSDVVWETDLVENTIFISKNFTSIFGHEILGVMPIKNSIWRQYVHPDDVLNVLKSEAEVIKGNGDKWECEYRFMKANGEYAIVLDRGFALKDESGNVVKMIGAMQDITLRKREEERIKLFETVIENTTEAIIIRNAIRLEAGGFPILYVNKAFEDMTGYDLEEVRGKSLKFLAGPLTDIEERAKLRNAMNLHLPAKMEVINYKKNGQQFWANVSVFPVANKSGTITHWVSIQRDVTERRKAEEEREQLINELIHNNKELKQFGYITTHNLRAPLTNLLSVCRLIDTSKIADSKTQRLIAGFTQSTTLLHETLNDLINILIIKENRNLTTANLSFEEILNNVKTSISNTISNANAIVEADFNEVQSIKFSKTYLESIFLNLLTNSIKYAHPERKLIVKIKTLRDRENKIKLVFSDNAIGMDMKRVKDRIFGLYQRFHNNADSKGIGLYLIHSQITALGGTIEVESEVNVGTTFSITFK